MNRRSFVTALLGLPIAVKAAAAKSPVFGRWFRNFGAGVPTVLHGTEAVLTKAQARNFLNAPMQLDEELWLDDIDELFGDLDASPGRIRAVMTAAAEKQVGKIQ